MSKLIKCKGCEKEVFKSAKTCPSCGKDQRNWFVRNRVNVALLTVSGLSIITVIDYKNLEKEFLLNSQTISTPVVEQRIDVHSNINEEDFAEQLLDDKKETEVLEKEETVEESTKEGLNKDEKISEDIKDKTPVGKSSISKDDSEKAEGSKKEKLSFEEENAFRNADQHVKNYPFSYELLVKKLVSEDFPKETAVLVVESLEVDWKEQAVLSAEFHLVEQGYSKKGLTKKLLAEGFIQEEIDYALIEVGY